MKNTLSRRKHSLRNTMTGRDEQEKQFILFEILFLSRSNTVEARRDFALSYTSGAFASPKRVPRNFQR